MPKLLADVPLRPGYDRPLAKGEAAAAGKIWKTLQEGDPTRVAAQVRDAFVVTPKRGCEAADGSRWVFNGQHWDMAIAAQARPRLAISRMAQLRAENMRRREINFLPASPEAFAGLREFLESCGRVTMTSPSGEMLEWKPGDPSRLPPIPESAYAPDVKPLPEPPASSFQEGGYRDFDDDYG